MSLDDNKVVTEITWYVGDIRSALEDAGYKSSDANVKKVLDIGFSDTLKMRVTEEGNIIVRDLISMAME